MDQERERIQADLRGLVAGDVRCDDLFLQLYASDASIYEVKPLGVVRPRGTADVVACVQYAAENKIPIHARGAGTGLAGESLGPGVVIDFSYAMRRVIGIDRETVRVQPGYVHSQLNRQLRSQNRLFGPDPATKSVSTIGGVLSLDGSGSHWPRYGSAGDRIENLQMVLADGNVVELGRANAARASSSDSPVSQLVRRLTDLVERESSLIETHTPKTCVNRCGYHLNGILSGGELDLARLIVGSEGTLGLITEATLKTDPLPRHTGVALLFFDRLDAAARGALEVAGLNVSACDLMDRRLLTLARETDVRYDLLIPRQAEAMLLVEFQDDDGDLIRERLQQTTTRLLRRKRLAFDSRSTMEPDELALYWRLAERVVPSLYRLKGTSRPLPFVEDIAIPPEKLPDFLVQMQNILKTHAVTASLFAHAGHGQLHLRPFLDMTNAEHVRKMQELAAHLYEKVLEAGGTISGEHGDGLSRTWFVRQQYGPLYDVFREVKRIFDPQNILNPGKKVADVPQPLTKNLRPVSPQSSGDLADGDRSPLVEPVELQLVWKEKELEYTTRACNGCGRCRSQLPSERMCPIFRFAPAEEATPRAKANLMRAVVTGKLSPAELTTDAVKSVADLCVNCHQCRLECPAGVDIPKLMVEAKAQHALTNGLRPSDWFVTRLDLISAIGTRFRPVVNWALSNRRMRWLMEKLLGIAQGRKMPRFASSTFIRRAHRRRLTRPSRRSGTKVLYFVDIYANYYDPQLAEAFINVLEHNGLSVYVPPGQMWSGMSMISSGLLEKSRRLAAANVKMLAEAVRQGYTIVATEPSATLCLTHEYPNLLDDDDVQLVAENTHDACEFLWASHQHGKLELDLSPLNVTLGYHLPCHLKALQIGTPGENLLKLIPGLKVVSLESGCSGMAGTYGMKREHYRSSLRAGWSLISALRDREIHVGTTECSACKIQMEQGTTKPTIHPIKMLALSYGLMPELGSLLTTYSEELVVS